MTLEPEDLADLAGRIVDPDADAARDARERQDRLAKPQGALGALEGLSAWVCAVQGSCPPSPFARPRVVVFAGDHGVARRTSAYPPEVTAGMVRAFLEGRAAVNVLAGLAGAGVRVVDMSVDAPADHVHDLAPETTAHRVRRGTGAIDVEDAMTRDEAWAALSAGIAIADEEVDSGADLLIAGDMGIGNTTPAAALTGLLCSRDASLVVGRGTGIDDIAWMRKCGVVRDAMRRGRRELADPVGLLATVAGPDIAAMVGFLLGACVRRTPVILDGTVVTAAALVAQRVCYRAPRWWRAGHRSTEPAHAIALDRLDLAPVVDLGMRLGEGTGALVALPLVQAAAATLRDMSTLDEAGVHGRSPA